MAGSPTRTAEARTPPIWKRRTRPRWSRTCPTAPRASATRATRPSRSCPAPARGAFDRAYAAAVSSPYRLGGAVRVGCDGSNITVHYESDPVFIDACVDPSDPDGSMLSVMRLVDACHAIAAAGRSVRRVDATEGTLVITMADRSQVLVQPSMCEATRFDAHGDLIQSATLNPHPAGASKPPRRRLRARYVRPGAARLVLRRRRRGQRPRRRPPPRPPRPARPREADGPAEGFAASATETRSAPPLRACASGAPACRPPPTTT